MRSWAACLSLAALWGCGESAPPSAGAETGAYWHWRQKRTEVPAAFGESVRGTISIAPPPDARVKRPDDFCEVWLNGKVLHRLRLARLPDGGLPSAELDVQFRTGPNWIDVWDSTSNEGSRHPFDSREGAELSLTPAERGYDFTQTKRE